MRLAIILSVAVSLAGSAEAKEGVRVAARAKAKAPAKAKTTAPADTAASSAAGTPSAAPVESPEAAAKAMAAPAAKFEEAALYAITTKIGGDEYALTYVPDAEAPPDAITSFGSTSKVELQKLTGSPGQMWRPNFQRGDPPSHLLYSKISASTKRLTGVMWLVAPDQRFIDDDKYHEKHNRLSVGGHGNDIYEYWYIAKLDNGKHRIMSVLGLPEHLNKPGETYREKWNESRWLTAVTTGGKPKLRQQKAADTPAQEWTFTKVGTYFEE